MLRAFSCGRDGRAGMRSEPNQLPTAQRCRPPSRLGAGCERRGGLLDQADDRRRCWPIRAAVGGAGSLPVLLLAAGGVASLAANVTVAEPTMTGRVIAAWPWLTLIGSYELLMRQIRATATAASTAARDAGFAPGDGPRWLGRQVAQRSGHRCRVRASRAVGAAGQAAWRREDRPVTRMA